MPKKKKRASWKEMQRKRRLRQKKWSKGKIFGIFCLVIAIFGIYGYWQYYNSQLPPAIGGDADTSPPPDLAPTFSIKDINGTQFSLSQHNGKVIVLHFMAVGCSGQIYTINDNQLKQLKMMCSLYCGKKPFLIVTVAVATCPNSQLASIRSSYGVTWVLGNDYDDRTLDIVNAYTAYSINDGSIILIDKTFHVKKVYTNEIITADAVSSIINQLLEA